LTFTALEADLPLLYFFWFYSGFWGGGRGLSGDKTNHQGQEKSKQAFRALACFFTALDTALMADRRLFTVLFYLKKSNNSKQKRDVPAVCDGVGRGAMGCGYLT
jgi:hypothetical protein